MKYSIFVFACVLLFASCSKQRSGKPRILLFSKTSGYHHASIPDGIAAIEKLGTENNFDVDTTTNAAYFHEDTLKRYSAVIFLSTTGDLLNNYQEADFERYIQAGGGYVGIHAAADGEYDWGWYGRLTGGYFYDHPGINDTLPNVQPGKLEVVDKDNLSTKSLPAPWARTDEWYSFKKLNDNIKVVLKIDEQSYQGGKKMGDHPMAWFHDYDGGRAFYTALGHTKESYTEPLFLQHLLGGINYAIGKNEELNYSKATAKRTPEEDRFTKKVLVGGEFYEPTEMTILPNLDILIAQRRGEILMYKNGDSTVHQAGFINTYFKTKRPDVNAEEGILGIKADPNFNDNHYVYIFYSPADTSVNRLSRFKLENDVLDMKSEKVVMQFYSQREICCHTGGSIAFDKDGLLYVSTGDNSTPFDEPKQTYVNHGFAPLDQRPGHEQYDARRTSGNANDLRGKILRIKVNEDGTYAIPEGNLYPEGQKGARPEIYVQGNRNPYRIAIDQKNNFLYWGEVGPDAANDSLAIRGPRGYDEVNQARKAGFFGWPLFIGNNYAYHEYDYEHGKVGDAFDPQKPMNTSLNNTGITELPPAQPAFIWYPYGQSPEFPQVKAGGRNAMAGPVYYTDMFPEKTRLPDYYNNKLFIYDWIRGWIKAVTMLPNGDFDKMEPFIGQIKLNSLIDMEVGPDGKLYLLEYGTGWFSKNKDSGLSRIDYNSGNVAPKITDFKVDKVSGAVPLTVTATVKANDLERKPLKYEWSFGDGNKKETTEPQVTFTFEKTGAYVMEVKVIDAEESFVKSAPITVYSGNAYPEVTVTVKGNKSFYFPEKKVDYTVTVKDDESTDDLSALFVSADYLSGRDRAATVGHQAVTDQLIGKNLVQSGDCKTCHKQDESSIGPAYKKVAERYQNSPEAFNQLAGKIMKGGSGVWGETNMPAHPDMKETEAKQIVTWILSLADTKPRKSLPTTGTINPTLDKAPAPGGRFLLSASYTDKGGSIGQPLTSHAEITLRNNRLNFNDATDEKGFISYWSSGNRIMVTPKGRGSFYLNHIDLTNVSSMELEFFWKKLPTYSASYEIHLDAVDGPVIGEGKLQPALKDNGKATLKLKTSAVKDEKFHALYFVSSSPDGQSDAPINLKTVLFSVQ